MSMFRLQLKKIHNGAFFFIEGFHLIIYCDKFNDYCRRWNVMKKYNYILCFKLLWQSGITTVVNLCIFLKKTHFPKASRALGKSNKCPQNQQK